MIDFVDFFEKQIAIWNDEELCDSCWKFEFSERLSEINESNQTDDDCCIMVFLTDYRPSKIRNYNTDSQYKMSERIRYTFSLYFLQHDRIDINVHKEIKGHPVEESKWNTILKPIIECVGDFDFCELIGKPVQYLRDEWNPVLDFQDNNYSGWRVQLQFEERL